MLRLIVCCSVSDLDHGLLWTFNKNCVPCACLAWSFTNNTYMYSISIWKAYVQPALVQSIPGSEPWSVSPDCWGSLQRWCRWWVLRSTGRSMSSLLGSLDQAVAACSPSGEDKLSVQYLKLIIEFCFYVCVWLHTHTNLLVHIRSRLICNIENVSTTCHLLPDLIQNPLSLYTNRLKVPAISTVA